MTVYSLLVTVNNEGVVKGKTEAPASLHSIPDLLRASLIVCRQRLTPIFGLMLIQLAIWVLVDRFVPAKQLLSPVVVPSPEFYRFVAITFIGGILSFWVNIALIITMAAQKKLDVFDSLRLSFRKVPAALVFSIVYSLWIVIGLLLLVVPGIIFTVWWAFGIFSIVLEHNGLRTAMARSRMLTEGRFWPIIGRLMVLGIVSLVIQMVASLFTGVDQTQPSDIQLLVGQLGNIIFLPFATAYMYLLFRELVMIHKHPSVWRQSSN